MATMIPLDEAQTRLRELVDQMFPGEELVITDNQRPVARLVGPVANRPVPRLVLLRWVDCRLH